MKLQGLKKQLARNLLAKADFIKAAGKFHQALFQYPEIIAACDVNEIRVNDAGLAFQIGPHGLWLQCPAGEYRVAPLEIMNFGAYEPQETQLMMSLVAGEKVILDIGANIGWFSLLFATQTAGREIHAFEPLPIFYNYLEKNVKLNKFDKFLFIYQFGFSDECKSVNYFVDAGNGTNASLCNVAASDTVDVIKGKVVTLDHWVSEMKIKPDFIKCDVEGAEYLVMKGAQSVLSLMQPVVFLEMLRKWAQPYGYHPNDIIALFDSHDYLCCGVGETGNRIVASVDDDTTETNYVFLHRKKHLSQIALLGLQV